LREFLSALIAVSLLLVPHIVLSTPSQGVTTNSSQSELDQQPLVCERVRIILRNGKKIDADSYRHQEDHVEITRKDKSQTILDKDIKRVDVSQGSCLDVVVTLKSGKKTAGYWRGKTCDSHRDCNIELTQNKRVLTIPASDIKSLDISRHRTLREKLEVVAFIPLYPLYALLVFITLQTRNV